MTELLKNFGEFKDIATTLDGSQVHSGGTTYLWNNSGEQISTGLYFKIFKVENHTSVGKMLLLK